jgi:hypothetical protein
MTADAGGGAADAAGVHLAQLSNAEGCTAAAGSAVERCC